MNNNATMEKDLAQRLLGSPEFQLHLVVHTEVKTVCRGMLGSDPPPPSTLSQAVLKGHT